MKGPAAFENKKYDSIGSFKKPDFGIGVFHTANSNKQRPTLAQIKEDDK